MGFFALIRPGVNACLLAMTAGPFLFVSLRSSAAVLAGARGGFVHRTGPGIDTINQRLGDSRILPVSTDHTNAWEAGLSGIYLLEAHPLLVDCEVKHSNQSVSAAGISSSVQSVLTTTELDCAGLWDLMKVPIVFDFMTKIKLSSDDILFAAGVDLGLMSLTHQLKLDSNIDITSIAYKIRQNRFSVGPKFLLGYNLGKNFYMCGSFVWQMSFPINSKAKIDSFVVDSLDLTENVRQDNGRKLTPAQLSTTSVALGLSYTIQ